MRTTFAVFLPTPGSDVSSSISEGTSPPKSDISLDAAPLICFAFILKKPQVLISCSSSLNSASAKDSNVGYLTNKSLVTSFTLLSVH